MKNQKKYPPIKIHLAVDGSEHSFAAAQLIHDLALPHGSEVTALGVFTPRKTIRKHKLLAVLDEVKTIIAKSGIEVNTGLLHGSAAAALRDFDEIHPPDLLVIGAKGRTSSLGILLGGVAQQIVEHARKPVLVVRTPHNGLRRVLLAYDGSKYSEHALRILKRFPFLAGSELHVIHVLPQAEEADLDDGAQEIAAGAEPTGEIETHEGQKLINHVIDSLKAAGIEATGVLRSGEAATEIIEYAKANQIDMIVTGGRGLDAVRGWFLGSVSRKLIHYAHCSVLVEKGV